jgi:hypothetical protein
MLLLEKNLSFGLRPLDALHHFEDAAFPARTQFSALGFNLCN